MPAGKNAPDEPISDPKDGFRIMSIVTYMYLLWHHIGELDIDLNWDRGFNQRNIPHNYVTQS